MLYRTECGSVLVSSLFLLNCVIIFGIQTCFQCASSKNPASTYPYQTPRCKRQNLTLVAQRLFWQHSKPNLTGRNREYYEPTGF